MESQESLGEKIVKEYRENRVEIKEKNEMEKKDREIKGRKTIKKSRKKIGK